jgi:hypothetical protein
MQVVVGLVFAVAGCQRSSPLHERNDPAQPESKDAGQHDERDGLDAPELPQDAGGLADGGWAHDGGPEDPKDAASERYEPDPVTMGSSLPTRLPVLRLKNVSGQQIEKDVEIKGELALFENHDGTLEDLDKLTPTFSTSIGLQGRGNFTWTLPKKGYAFELQDEAGADIERSILGLPEGSDFALYACYSDKTCLRSALVFALGQQLGRWSPRTRFVELVLDGEYQGLYMLFERIRRDGQRCDIAKPAATKSLGDLSGGYIFRVEGDKQEVGSLYPQEFSLPSGRIYNYHYPKAESITAEQAKYLRDSVQGFEDAMKKDPRRYGDWIDVGSWVDHAIVEELTNNWDGYVHSVYVIKEATKDGGKLVMGPLWDFDLAFANGNVTGYNCRTDNWAYQNKRPAPDDVAPYWLQLFAQPDFQEAFKCRWRALRKDALSLSTLDARMAAWSIFTAEARARDQAKWATMGKSIFPNCFAKASYADETAALREWIVARVEWLDAEVEAMPGSCADG